MRTKVRTSTWPTSLCLQLLKRCEQTGKQKTNNILFQHHNHEINTPSVNTQIEQKSNIIFESRLRTAWMACEQDIVQWPWWAVQLLVDSKFYAILHAFGDSVINFHKMAMLSPKSWTTICIMDKIWIIKTWSLCWKDKYTNTYEYGTVNHVSCIRLNTV